MNSKLESILLDFITVYLHDRGKRPDDECIKQELTRLYAECEINASMLIDQTNYEN